MATTIADGANATVTFKSGDLLTVTCRGSVKYENPVGTVVAEFGGTRTYGPFNVGGQFKLTSNLGAVVYEVDDTSTDNIQSKLDAVSERATTVRISSVVSPTSAITMGNTSAIIGENANLTVQTGKYFAPRPLLDFSASAMDGIQTDGSSTYRCQKVKLESITLRGSGDTNGKVGIKWVQNATAGHPGLAVLRDVYIQEFQTGIDCAGIDDSHDYRDVHIQRAQIGINNVNQQTVIDHLDIWNMKGAAGTTVGVSVDGTNNVITRSEFEGGDYPTGEAATTDATGVAVSLESTSEHNTVQANRFQHAIGTYYADFGICNSCVGNLFTPYTKTVTRFARLQGTQGLFANNVLFTGGTVSSDAIIVNGSYYTIANNIFRRVQSAVNCIVLAGSYNKVVHNLFDICTGVLSNVKVNAGAIENVLVGHFPDGVNDLGTRTVINGISTNDGAPGSAGQWNGQAAKAYALGVTVENTAVSPHTFYRADSAGNWVQIG